MEQMPSDVILSIFSHLDHYNLCLGARLVCTRWWDLTHDSSLWTNVFVREYFSSTRLQLILDQIHDHIEVLDMGHCSCETKAGFLKLARRLKFPRMKRLVLPSTKGGQPKDYKMLSKACPDLREFNFVSRITSHGCLLSIIHEDCVPIQSQFPNLEVFRDDYDIEDESIFKRWSNFEDTTNTCQRIKSYHGTDLHMRKGHLEIIPRLIPDLQCLDITLRSDDHEAIQQLFSNLKKSLYRLTIVTSSPLSEEVFEAISTNCPNLRYLVMKQVYNWDYDRPSGLQHLVSNCHQLAYLKVDVFAIENIGIGLAHLTTLDLLKVDPPTDGIHKLVSRCPWLQHLTIHDCSNIEDSVLHSLTNLRFLKIVALRVCAKITPDGLINFLISAPSLNVVEFSPGYEGFVAKVTNVLYKPVASRSTEADTRHVRSEKSHITTLRVGIACGSALEIVSEICPNLRNLNILTPSRKTAGISESNIINCIRFAPFLESLDVSRLECLTDNFLACLCQHAVHLRELNLGDSGNEMTMSALVEVIKCCTALTSIEMVKLIPRGNVKYVDKEVNHLVTGAKHHRAGQCILHTKYRANDGMLGFGSWRFTLHFRQIAYLESTKIFGLGNNLDFFSKLFSNKR